MSLHVASERAALEDVETEIVLAQRDIRLLQTEIGTRGRLAQLERWNAKVLALSAPSADQFLEGGFQLARLAQPEHKVDFEAPVVLASAPRRTNAAPIGEPRDDAARDARRIAARRCCMTQPQDPDRDARGPGKPAAAPQAAGTKPRPSRLRRRSRPQTLAATKLRRKPPRGRPLASWWIRSVVRRAGDKAGRPPTTRLPAPRPSLRQKSKDFRHPPDERPDARSRRPRPERLRLVGQRRQILAVMHQRLMFGMLVYAGVIAIIALRILYLAAFGDHAGRKGGLTSLIPERGDIVDRDGQPLARTIDAWTIASTRPR